MFCGDGGHIQALIGTAFEQVTWRIYLVQSLHNHNDASPGRVIKARQQGLLNKLLCLDQPGYGAGISSFQQIVDDDVISAVWCGCVSRAALAR
ncbi:hypothetical protein [Ruegeria arenilitoris]|uniref:hypothetical protein n=1 Tax=Ruegeria arenilitoris TaxID=1173585 RepID=UPI00147B18D6|nr:hypothetical protein [Ruegeria arenilitoris]